MDKSVELPMDLVLPSQDLVLVESGSPQRSTKITARAENLLAIHRKILLHLRNQKPLKNFELHKLLAILKRIDCSSPRDEKVARSAHEILVKCIYSQSSKEEKTLQQNISNTSLNSSTASENKNESLESTSDDVDTNSHQYVVESKTDQHLTNQLPSVSTPHETELLQLNEDISASNIFSSQTTQCDEEMSFVKEMVVPDDKEEALLATTSVLSQTFLRRHLSVSSNINMHEIDNDGFEINNIIDIDKYDDENISTEPFTVPTLIEKRDYSNLSQSSNVLKLRFADVQFDSDTVSIPLELLTNLNFGSGEKQSQEITGTSIQTVLENKISSGNHVEKNTSDTSTQISNFTELNDTYVDINTTSSDERKSPFKTMDEDLSRNKFIQTYEHTKRGYSLKRSNNIECTTTTSNSTADLQAISSFSTIKEISFLNIEMEATNKGKSNVENPKALLAVPYVRHSQYLPRKTALHGIVTNAKSANIDNAGYASRNNHPHAEHFDVRYTPDYKAPINTKNDSSNGSETNINCTNAPWCVPLPMNGIANVKYATLNDTVISGNKNIDNLLDTKNATVQDNANNDWIKALENIPDDRNRHGSSETPDVTYDRLVPMKDAMEICNSWMEEQGNMEMTEAEKRYLDMAANNTESETNDFILDQNKMERRSPGNETDEDSFVFQNANYYSSDIIEATPYDNLRKKSLNKRIKTLLPKKPETQVATTNPLIINETEDIIIDETPCDVNSETPSIIIIDETPCRLTESLKNRSTNSVSDSVEDQSLVQTPMSQQHLLFNPYKKRHRLNCFQETYKSNYQRKIPKTVSQESKINILGNIILNTGSVTQSQSFGAFTSERKNAGEAVKKVAVLDMSDSLSLKQFTNITLVTPPSPTNNTDEIELTMAKNPKPVVSENIILIDGASPKNTEQMDTTQIEPEEDKETFEEKTRKLREKIMQKRCKYRETWKDKPVKEKISLKYVKKFGVNIFEDPVKSLLNIQYEVNVNNFHFPRLTLDEMNEKLIKSCEKANLLNEALTKMVDLQISGANEENYKLNMTKDVARNLDSDDSSDDEETKRKNKLEEIKFMSRLELKKFKEEMEKERKKEMRLQKDIILTENNDDEENEEKKVTNGKEQTSKFIQHVRQAVDCSWLK